MLNVLSYDLHFDAFNTFLKMAEKNDKILRVLLVDPSALAAYQTEHLLNSIRKCDVEKTESARGALKIISEKTPDLILTEWELADLTASELLNTLSSRDKLRTIPVIITTFFRSKNMIILSKKLGAKGVLYKPVERDLLARYLTQMFPGSQSTRKIDPLKVSKHIQEKLKQVDKMAPLPSLAMEIIEICNNPKSTARNLAEIVKRDQALTARLLKIVNSAYYNFYRKISDINRAIVILGLEEVKNISLAACLIILYPSRQSPYFNNDEYWRHAFGTAHITKSMAKFCPGLPPEDAFTMGLLHDFGKVLLDQNFGEIFDTILKIAATRKQPLHLVSRELIKINHADIGGLVGESWKLPIPLIKAIRYHHEPYLSFEDTHVNLVHLANYFCHKYNIGKSGNPAPDEVYPGSLPALGLQDKDLDEVWKAAGIEKEKIVSII